MRFLSLATLTFVYSACSFSPELNVACGVDDLCPRGMFCDPMSKRCVKKLPGPNNDNGNNNGTTPELDLSVGCVPLTCAETQHCGNIPDGCGGTITCMCPDGQDCSANNICSGCKAMSCDELKGCGDNVDNGCGGLENCGPCKGSDLCKNGRCVPCMPKKCDSEMCGYLATGCGSEFTKCPIDCASGQRCNASNHCESGTCTPTNPCTPDECGIKWNGCENEMCKKQCTAPESCGGGGTANHCGCTAKSCANLARCGTSLLDGCGGTIDCNCPHAEECVNASCCRPRTNHEVCGGLIVVERCGQFSDGCAATIDCTCPRGKHCQRSVCLNDLDMSVPRDMPKHKD